MSAPQARSAAIFHMQASDFAAIRYSINELTSKTTPLLVNSAVLNHIAEKGGPQKAASDLIKRPELMFQAMAMPQGGRINLPLMHRKRDPQRHKPFQRRTQ